jgi:geranylgeranyl diphosphate synthase, type II
MQIGAILGGATDGTANLLYEFGKNLGISFQLKDDYLDAFGEGDKIGKQVGGDIIANKKTFLLLKAQELATDADAIALAEALLDNSSEKVQKVLAIFDKLQIKQEAQNAKEKYSKLAFDYLDKLPVQETRKQELHKVADWLLNREA